MNKEYCRSDEAILNSLLLRKRFDLATSQAISILVTSFTSDVYTYESLILLLVITFNTRFKY